MENLLTTQQVADRLDVTEGWVRTLCISGQLPARKHGRSWAVTEADLERYRMEKNFNEDPRRNGED